MTRTTPGPLDFDESGQALRRAKIKISAESLIPPAFAAAGMAYVPGGFGRYVKDGKRIEKSPEPIGTSGLAMLDTAAVLELASQAADQAWDFDKGQMAFDRWFERQGASRR